MKITRVIFQIHSQTTMVCVSIVLNFHFNLAVVIFQHLFSIKIKNDFKVALYNRQGIFCLSLISFPWKFLFLKEAGDLWWSASPPPAPPHACSCNLEQYFGHTRTSLWARLQLWMCVLRRQHRAEPWETVTVFGARGRGQPSSGTKHHVSEQPNTRRRVRSSVRSNFLLMLSCHILLPPFPLFASVTWPILPCLPSSCCWTQSTWDSQLAVLVGLPLLCSFPGRAVLISLILISPMCHRKMQQTYPPKPFFGRQRQCDMLTETLVSSDWLAWKWYVFWTFAFICTATRASRQVLVI